MLDRCPVPRVTFCKTLKSCRDAVPELYVESISYNATNALVSQLNSFVSKKENA